MQPSTDSILSKVFWALFFCGSYAACIAFISVHRQDVSETQISAFWTAFFAVLASGILVVSIFFMMARFSTHVCHWFILIVSFLWTLVVLVVLLATGRYVVAWVFAKLFLIVVGLIIFLYKDVALASLFAKFITDEMSRSPLALVLYLPVVWVPLFLSAPGYAVLVACQRLNLDSNPTSQFLVVLFIFFLFYFYQFSRAMIHMLASSIFTHSYFTATSSLTFCSAFAHTFFTHFVSLNVAALLVPPATLCRSLMQLLSCHGRLPCCGGPSSWAETFHRHYNLHGFSHLARRGGSFNLASTVAYDEFEKRDFAPIFQKEVLSIVWGLAAFTGAFLTAAMSSQIAEKGDTLCLLVGLVGSFFLLMTSFQTLTASLFVMLYQLALEPEVMRRYRSDDFEELDRVWHTYFPQIDLCKEP